jgi:hypothetical protein
LTPGIRGRVIKPATVIQHTVTREVNHQLIIWTPLRAEFLDLFLHFAGPSIHHRLNVKAADAWIP